MSRLPVAVLISGGGTNLQSIIDATVAGRLAVDIGVVVSDQPDAYGLQRARAAGIATEVQSDDGFADREAYDASLAEVIDRYQPQLLVLAGFMRILSPPFVRRYSGRMLNIHPSLLPAYRGLHTHRRVLAAGDSLHGCSIHFVTDVLDGGPLIVQAPVPVRADDDEQRLSARVQAQEHKLYPQVIGWFADGRLQMRDEAVWLDGKRLDEPLILGQDLSRGDSASSS